MKLGSFHSADSGPRQISLGGLALLNQFWVESESVLTSGMTPFNFSSLSVKREFGG